MNATINDSATLNLRRLCLIRSIVLAGQSFALLFAVQIWNWPLPVGTLSMILAGMGLVTLATWWRARQPWPIADEEFVAHLLVDVVALTLVMYEAGGASNPFVSFFLVPICIAATTLPWRFTWLIAAISVTAYSGLLFFYQPLLPLEPHHAGSGLNLHVIGMWFNFAVSAALITYFVVQMSGAVRRRDQALAKIREQRLQDEQLLAIATLAAGTAHELGTPLSTMRIITDELLDEVPANLKDEVATLDGQLTLCKDILNRLTSTAQDFSAGRTSHIPVHRFFSLLKEHWQLLRPSVHDANFDIDVAPNRLMVMDTTLEQAIINLLNNAADVSPDKVSLHCFLEGDVFVVAIEDEGPGLPPGQADRLGKPFISTKGKGLGLGLFVSHAAANRYGGELLWHNRKPLGSRVELRLPGQGVLIDGQ